MARLLLLFLLMGGACSQANGSAIRSLPDQGQVDADADTASDVGADALPADATPAAGLDAAASCWPARAGWSAGAECFPT